MVVVVSRLQLYLEAVVVVLVKRVKLSLYPLLVEVMEEME